MQMENRVNNIHWKQKIQCNEKHPCSLSCGQRLIFPIEATTVQCSICCMLKTFPPAGTICCKGCGLTLVYGEQQTAEWLFCTVCYALQSITSENELQNDHCTK
eukprot:jgi/Galph1/6095/GphlegSOOS_G4760.1